MPTRTPRKKPVGKKEAARRLADAAANRELHRRALCFDELVAAMPTIGHPGGRLVKVVAHYESGATQTINGDVVTAAVSRATTP